MEALLALSLLGLLVLLPTWRLCTRAGLPPYLAFFALIPAGMLVVIWFLAFLPWPVEKSRDHYQRMLRERRRRQAASS